MQGRWTEITGGTKGNFSIFNNTDQHFCGSSDQEGQSSVSGLPSTENRRDEVALSVEKSALINFFNSSCGGQWTQAKNWCSADEPVAKWFGLATHADSGLLRSIRLTENNLNAPLKSLLPHLRAFGKLEEIWLAGNRISGKVPAQLCDCASLKKLDLSRNGLVGTLHKRLALCKNFEWFDISGNMITVFYKAREVPKDAASLKADGVETVSQGNPANASSAPTHVLSYVYTTTSVLTKADSDSIIKMAEEHAEANGGWQTDRHHMYKTTDIDVRHAPHLLEFCNNKLESRIIPVLGSLFNIPLNELEIDDLFVVKYKCGDGENSKSQTSLAPHRDDSVLSFVILLNHPNSFDGGGTEFVNFRPRLVAAPQQQGTMVSFCGQILHAGKQITRGERLILAGFVRVNDSGGALRRIADKIYPRSDDDGKSK